MLTDEGPDLSSQASKLWTSREDFQQNVNAPPPIDVIAPLLNDLAESFTRLAINSTPSHPIPPTDDIDGLPPSPHSHQSSKSSTSSGVPHTMSKQEKDRRTVNAHSILANIESHMQVIPIQIVSSTSISSVQKIRTELSTLKTALKNITYCASSVVECKKGLMVQVDQLFANIEVKEGITDGTSDKPISYECDRYIHLVIETVTTMTTHDSHCP